MKKSKLPNPLNKFQHHPDAKLHQEISFLKSGVRIVGYIFLFINIPAAAVLLIVSEIIGIVEELV